jgi:hypothetical protein
VPPGSVNFALVTEHVYTAQLRAAVVTLLDKAA